MYVALTGHYQIYHLNSKLVPTSYQPGTISGWRRRRKCYDTVSTNDI